MANEPISQLTELTEAPATADVFPFVDVSDTTQAASGSTKKVTYENILKGMLLAIPFLIDGGGATIATGIKGDLEVPFAFEILQVTMLADQSGSIVVDIWKDSYANFPPTDADSITASAPPTISSATKSQDSTLTGWTKTGAAGSIIRFNVDSCTGIQRVLISLKVRRT